MHANCCNGEKDLCQPYLETRAPIGSWLFTATLCLGIEVKVLILYQAHG